MSFIFQVDSDIKQEYLNLKPTTTAQSEYFVLRSADEYEAMLDKKLYNMSYSELRDLIAMQFKNSSVKSIIKNVSVLRGYIDFCINKKVVLHGENRLSSFTIDDAKDFVHKQALLNKFISRETLLEYKKILYNEQDQLMLELLYTGVRGRATKEGSFEEIINLSIDDIDFSNRIMILRQNNGEFRVMTDVDISTLSLIEETYNQEFYVENNGEETENKRLSRPRRTVINHVGKYVFRIPGKKRSDKFTPQIMNSRMYRIKKYLGNPYLSFTSLFQSGMIQMAIDIYKEKGFVDKEDFIDICVRYNYENYWYNIRDLFNQYKEILLD